MMDMKKVRCVGLACAQRFAFLLVAESRWFECKPYPDDEWRFILKNEDGLSEIIANAKSVGGVCEEYV